MLYVVATPIGNLGDITVRALQVLKSVDVVAAEDTRHSGMLLKHFEIKKPLLSYHEHNEAMRTAQLVERLAADENVALITDAGTPALSDPGARLIHACIERGLPLTVIPGPSSILAALVGAGFSTERFYFGGILRGFSPGTRLWLTQLSRLAGGSIASRKATRSMSIFLPSKLVKSRRL